MHVQDTCATLAKLCIAMWKETFQAFLKYWKSQWLLINKCTMLSNQESAAVCKIMFCNAICSNPKFLQIKHLDKLRWAQGSSKITYHNYLTLLYNTAFQIDQTFQIFHQPQKSTVLIALLSTLNLPVMVVMDTLGITNTVDKAKITI